MKTVDSIPLHTGSRRRHFLASVRKHKLHLVMLIPVMAQFIIFKYGPLYGVTLAFKKYSPKAGIGGSPWIDPWYKWF
ncbi:MAG: hypothetical protein IKN05_09145, partial [Clostridia bacterium]|nr:hypothetical protein [Clostridia bacterium]